MTDFEGLLAALDEAGVEHIIVGGLAATIHGSSRLTQDVDVVYGRSDANLERLAVALGPHRPYLRGAPPGLPFDWSASTLRRGLNFTLTTSLGDIDLLGEITGGGGYGALLPHTVTVRLFGRSHRCLDLASLTRTKRAAGRPRDFEVRHLALGVHGDVERRREILVVPGPDQRSRRAPRMWWRTDR